MQFWSKGLGKKKINLVLSKGETLMAGDTLYVKGRMEAPVDWDYIMPLYGDDLVDFFDLLKDPSIAAYVYRSPHRWQLYWGMVVKGLQLGASVVAQSVLMGLGRAEVIQAERLQIPPPSVREKKKKRAAKVAAGDATAEPEAPKKPRRRRLSSRTTSAPALSQGMTATENAYASDVDPETQEAIEEAMATAAALD